MAAARRSSTSSSVASRASSFPGAVDVNEAARAATPRASRADRRSSSQADCWAELRCLRDGPGQDHGTGRAAYERLSHREQRVGASLIVERDENRPLRDFTEIWRHGFDVQ